ncbi:hypothetical protein NLU13_9444 [Sarocladium strictum]|uniref:Uncharacterized protein n=1 Tax=Sarocladium strictum TaxID=5046 RepID=A0AA39GB88_SARSR|nr:hypothetical protein NLU13_9444 [Sarocladium strictum]
MAPTNHQLQQERHLEDGLSTYGNEKTALRGETSPQTPDQSPSPPKPKFRIMNPRRFTVTFGLGLLVGFGLVASRSRPHRALCPQQIHASNEHEIKALVEQTKDDTSALSEILRCASPETFHRMVSVYFPEPGKPESDSGRAQAIGNDETWLLTAWEKLVKRQDDGTGDPSTPSGSATDDGAVVTHTTTVTADAPTSSDPVPDPATTSSEPVTNTATGVPTSTEVPQPSSTSEVLPESTTEAPISSSSVPVQETSSSVVPVESTTEAASSTTSTSSKPEPQTTTSEEEPDRPSKTTIHISSSAVKQTITTVNNQGSATTITSTSWVAVDPPVQTGESESDPSLQDASPSLRASVAPALFVGGMVTMLLMS